jgi:integrase
VIVMAPGPNAPLLQVAALSGPALQEELPQGCSEALCEIAKEGRSPNTPRSYAAALRYWRVWYEVVFACPFALPLSVAAVLAFIAHHAQRRNGPALVQGMPAEVDAALVRAGAKARAGALALSTILHRLAVLSAAHRQCQAPNPCQDCRVRQVLRDLRSAYARRGAAPRKKDAAGAWQLQAMLRTCDDSLRGLRDRAMLLFAWSTGGQRRSDVALTRIEQLHETEQGEFCYDLACTKTNPLGEAQPENLKPVVGAAAQALRDWLRASGIDSGYMFRRIVGHDRIGRSLSPDTFNDIVHKRARLAGLQDNMSAHSLRSGFVTQSLADGAGLPETMALTGHRSTRTVLSYTRVDRAAMRRTAAALVQRAAPSQEQRP